MHISEVVQGLKVHCMYSAKIKVLYLLWRYQSFIKNKTISFSTSLRFKFVLTYRAIDWSLDLDWW